MIARLVSGGQTGADRAALDVARARGIAYGGWCPRGGWAEDAPRPPGVRARWPLLRETDSADPAVRTRANVRDSDATLVLLRDPGGLAASPGTGAALAAARELSRPCAVVACDAADAAARVTAFVAALPDGVALNVAGPRESEQPGIAAAARAVLAAALG